MASAADLALLKRGTLVNFLGTAGRASLLLFPFLGARLYGDAFGAFALALATVNLLGALVSAGLGDATQYLSARAPEAPADPEAGEAARLRVRLRVLGVTALAAGLAVGVALGALGALALGAEAVARALFGRADLAPLLAVTALGLPWFALTAVLTAALRASMRMGGDVLVKSVVTPVALLGTLALLHGTGTGPSALAWAFAVSQLAGAAVALALFAREFPLRGLGPALRAAPARRLLRFALPQSLNMALYQATFDLDVLLLGAAGVPDRLLGAYRLASELARQVFTIRVAFAGVYASLIARLRHEGRLHLLSASLGRVSGWCTWLAAPVTLLLWLHRRDVLALGGDAGVDPGFMAPLLASALVSCALGLTGNALGMSGRPGLNLVNALVATALNAALNLTLVPSLGLAGAACGVLGAALVTQALQLVQTRRLLGVRFAFGELAPPLGAAAAAYALCAPLPPGAPPVTGWPRSAVFATLFAVFLVLHRRRRRARLAGEHPPRGEGDTPA